MSGSTRSALNPLIGQAQSTTQPPSWSGDSALQLSNTTCNEFKAEEDAKHQLVPGKNASRTTPTGVAIQLVDPLVVQQFKVLLATSSTRGEGKAKRKLPDVIQGRMASVIPDSKMFLMRYQLPKWIESLFEEFRYVPYDQMVPGAYKKPKDPDDDKNISFEDWSLASGKAVERTEFYWSVERAAALDAHHKVVLNILARPLPHSWEFAVLYDIDVRHAVAEDPSIDISTLDPNLLSGVMLRYTSKFLSKLSSEAHEDVELTDSHRSRKRQRSGRY